METTKQIRLDQIFIAKEIEIINAIIAQGNISLTFNEIDFIRITGQLMIELKGQLMNELFFEEDTKQDTLSNKERLSFKEAAQHLNYKESYLYKLCAEALVPHYKKGKRLLFIKSELDKWLYSNKVKTVDEIKDEAESKLNSKGGKYGW